MDLLSLVPYTPVLYMYRGSIAHNTYVPSTDPDSIDDIDLLGVYLEPIENYLGLRQASRSGAVEKKVVQDNVLYDCVFYELKKFVNMLLNGNPNVISSLWTKEEHIIYKSKFGQKLLDSANLFVGKHIHSHTIGYADDQVKRMTSYVKQGYMGDKRKQLIDKFGFDCKNAAHSIRLLQMGIEFLNTGKFKVYRDDDRDLIVDIKTGKWSLEEVKHLSNRMFELSQVVYERSTLPEGPQEEKVNKMVIDILLEYIDDNRGVV